MGFKEVPSDDPSDTNRHYVLESELPERWGAYYVFAHEFDGYAAFPNDLVERVNEVIEAWYQHHVLPDDLDLLRACLFHTARNSRFIEGFPSETDMEFLDPLVAKIKSKI